MRITRGYKKEEFERLFELNCLCFSGVERPTLEAFKQALSISDVFVARRDDLDTASPDILAFAFVQPKDVAYVWIVCTDPSVQRRGIAGNILRYIELYYSSQKYKTLRLDVHVDNPAQKLYYDRGYRVVRVRDGYYGGRDGLQMEKEIK